MVWNEVKWVGDQLCRPSCLWFRFYRKTGVLGSCLALPAKSTLNTAHKFVTIHSTHIARGSNSTLRAIIDLL
jgi:hypothetical protein